MEATRKRTAQRVVRMRDKQHLSWKVIGDELELSAGTARRLYDELKGPGQHVGLLPGKGGRSPVVPTRRRKAA